MATNKAEALPGSWRRYDEGVPLTPILAAALNAFQSEGYHGTTVRAIAAKAGLTMPALYYHHGNKEGILIALLDIAMDDVLAHIEAAVGEAGDDIPQQLANIVTVVALHATHRRDLASLHSEFRFLGAEGRAAYVARRDVLYNRLVGVLDEGAASGIFSQQDSHFCARALLGMILSTTDWYHVSGPATPEEIADQYVSLALNLVGASSARVT